MQPTLPELTAQFATEFPELSTPWQALYSPEPEISVLNEPLAVELGIDAEFLRSPQAVRWLLGNALPEGAQPVVQFYSGHQFGVFVPVLGDGRALLLGERVRSDGQVVDLHLKGSGKTPFARADGFAALGPMLREYLVGEAMASLKIPTTRALAVVATGRRISREGGFAPGAVLVRVAASHLRVGTFQFARATGDENLLRRLTHAALRRHYPHRQEDTNQALALLEEVVRAQAQLVAGWMSVGFIHGVMNTDNMTISGEGIDYGPCAFMDRYNPATVFSSIDDLGRYAYQNQPAIAYWNLARLGDALLPLIAAEEDEAVSLAESALAVFGPDYEQAWLGCFRRKVGLMDPSQVSDAQVAQVVQAALAQLQELRVDFTGFFRALTEAAAGEPDALRALLPEGAAWGSWLEQWRDLHPDPALMATTNPRYLLRNHLVDAALEAASLGDDTAFVKAQRVAQDPFTLQPELAEFSVPAPADAYPHRTFCGT